MNSGSNRGWLSLPVRVWRYWHSSVVNFSCSR